MNRDEAIAMYAADPERAERDKRTMTKIFFVEREGINETRLISEFEGRICTGEMLAALRPSLPHVPEHPSSSQHFYIGQPVEAHVTCKYDEWRGVPLWIAAVDAKLVTGEITYTVSESWPPANMGHLSDMWPADDLCARSPTVGTAAASIQALTQ